MNERGSAQTSVTQWRAGLSEARVVGHDRVSAWAQGSYKSSIIFESSWKEEP